jgi:hypothetical protein
VIGITRERLLDSKRERQRRARRCTSRFSIGAAKAAALDHRPASNDCSRATARWLLAARQAITISVRTGLIMSWTSRFKLALAASRRRSARLHREHSGCRRPSSSQAGPTVPRLIAGHGIAIAVAVRRDGREVPAVSWTCRNIGGKCAGAMSYFKLSDVAQRSPCSQALCHDASAGPST